MTHEIKLSQLRTLDLELHDCEIIANAINIFGSGQHPVAEAQKNLDYFDLTYLLECLDKGIDKATNTAFKEDVTELYCAIHSEHEMAKAGTGAYTE